VTSVQPITIDCQYLLPRFAAAYLLIENGEATFVETNTTHALPHLLGALKQAGLSTAAVKHVIITHVHLDHAGGAGVLMEQCPNATLLAHPRAAPHVVDPSKLVASARKVYGDARFDALYGRIAPVPQGRVRIMEDDQVLQWGSRTLRFLHTRGHANHHFCVVDSGTQAIFTGDAFGLCYPVLQGGGLFVFPSTSPTDFDATLARQSLERIVRSGATRAFLTHYGEVTQLAEAASQMKDHLDFSEALMVEAAASALPDDALEGLVTPRLKARLEDGLRARGLALDAANWDVLALDVDLNGQGVAHAARKRRKEAAAH
jgi:glyoxylase-like metal-dependent hydrolase (beta-lactamase superfamily II)